MINKIKSILSALSATQQSRRKGFTLVELLVVIGIIAILFAVVLVAINPAKRFAEANNARRLSDVNSILNGVLNYTVDQKGSLPPGLQINTTTTPNRVAQSPRVIGATDLTGDLICNTSAGVGTCDIPALGLCSTDADCNNACVNDKCTVTGNDCNTNGDDDCWGAASPGLDDECNANVCTVGSDTLAGPFVGYYCDNDNDCTGDAVTDINGGMGACVINTITARKAYNLSASGEGVVPAYLASVPADPANSGTTSKYYVIENVKGAGRIRVIACTPDDPEGDGYANNKIEVIR